MIKLASSVFISKDYFSLLFKITTEKNPLRAIFSLVTFISSHNIIIIIKEK